jgi:glycerol-1-phosphate dehydrogenase [NAD(P)+]
MSPSPYQADLDTALAAASDTKHLAIGHDNAADAARIFKDLFPGKKALVVADTRTWRVCGEKVQAALTASGIETDTPFIFDDPAIYAEYKFVDQLEDALKQTDAIPVAVGSGTINDLTKLASHHCGRRYISVATAASMDGYTAYGASITYQGSKQTFSCPAPLAVIADLDIIAAAPKGMNASGYADLLAKLTAGADWIVADALGIEPIDGPSWQMVQANLRDWLSDPAGVANGDPVPLENLVAGLMMGGFAMQHLQNSRPASGADHQFSHLWDMEHHKHEGKSVSHGFKVGIGTLSSAGMYEYLYTQDFENLDVDAAVAAWPTWDALAAEIDELFTIEEIRQKSLEEEKAKYPTADELRRELTALKACWPELRRKLQAHLPSRAELAEKLSTVGAPSTPEEIGISQDRLRTSYRQALHIRRRYTVLDVADRTGKFESAMESIFQPATAKV